MAATHLCRDCAVVGECSGWIDPGMMVAKYPLTNALMMKSPSCFFVLFRCACCVLLGWAVCGCQTPNDYSLQTRAVLERLDEEILSKGRYQPWRQEQLDKLSARAEAEISPLKRAECLFALSQSYVTFNLDSAAFYCERIYRLADQSGIYSVRRFAILADIDVWLGRGQASLAEGLFRKIDTVGMTSLEYTSWHGRYSGVCTRRVYASEDPDTRRAWMDTLSYLRRMEVAGHSALTKARMRAATLVDSARYDEALELLKPFGAQNLDHPSAALLYYTMSGIAGRQGDSDAELRYLAESSISDLRAGTRSYSSLYDLAQKLFDRKEYDRAASYMDCTFQDAMLCKSVARIPASSFASIKISDAISANIAERQKLMVSLIALAGLFLVVVTGVLWFVLWQHRRLKANHSQLMDMSGLLQEKNDELQQKNDQIRDMNSVLVDSNRIKDRYVGHYIDLSAGYITQMESFRREVCRIAKTKGAEELVRQLNASREINGEFQKFYQTFDASFLDIFPNFIEQVNVLLQPEFRVVQRTETALTTELRILAAIRLGVTDSGHIASLLNCASATVYTYRTKLRNAAIDRDHFEEQVSRIGL